MKAKAFAPATVANVAVGFDILGFALATLGEHAVVEKLKESRVVVEPIAGYPDLSLDPALNTATAGLLQLIKDKKLNFGFRVSLEKQIPIGSGLGGSSTSAVAAIVAANALLPKKISREELLHYALIGEEVASGARHADNVGPCLEGGFVLVDLSKAQKITQIKTSRALRVAILLPAVSINTKASREALSKKVALATVIQQTANLAGVLLGLAQNRPELIRQSLIDVMIEPQRQAQIPDFRKIQQTALKAGALGCSISGSGPAIFALAENEAWARRIVRSWKKSQPGALTWISPLAQKGAHVLWCKK